MKKLLEVALGLLTALGGFVDIGDLVFATQSGALFGVQLLWALALGTIIIMLFSEMSGRVAAISKQANFTLITKTYPLWLNRTTLVASKFVNVLTCAAEIGGVALVLQLLSGLPLKALIVMVFLGFLLIVRWLSFSKLERLFGYGGLGLLVLGIAALHAHPAWAQVGQGFIPKLGPGSLRYFYFAVGLIAATLMPYEIYFYSAGALEEKWNKKDLWLNRVNSYVGFALGGLLVAGIIIVSAKLFQPLGIEPQFINTPALATALVFGKVGLLICLLGMLFTIAGSALETCFSGAYNLAQYMRWPWGRRKDPHEVPKFTISWIVIFLISFAIIITGIDAVALTEYAVIFSVVVMPLTYLPVLLSANNKKLMGQYANGKVMKALGWASYAVICVVAVAAVPLMILTARGAH